MSRRSTATRCAITDQFFLGPSLVRGFAPNGIGPRDVGIADARSNAIGGSTYVGGTLEVQFPICPACRATSA